MKSGNASYITTTPIFISSVGRSSNPNTSTFHIRRPVLGMTIDADRRAQIHKHGNGWRLRVYAGKGMTKNYCVRYTLAEAEQDREDVKNGLIPQPKQRGTIECRSGRYRARMWVNGKTRSCLSRASMEEAAQDLSRLRSEHRLVDQRSRHAAVAVRRS